MSDSTTAARAHMNSAQAFKSELGRIWSAGLEAKMAAEDVTIIGEDRGLITVAVNWPTGVRELMTDAFKGYVMALWSCLDSLVVESAHAFSVQRRLRDPSRPRFFPVADSLEAFSELLAESCVDGILREQVKIVHDVQPFHVPARGERLNAIRRSIQRLLDWDHALESGEQITAWATPDRPRVRVRNPVRVVDLEVEPPGRVDAERVVATFRLEGYKFGRRVLGQAGTYLDLCFAAGFDPAASNDTFERRLNETTRCIARIVAAFEWYGNETSVVQRVVAERDSRPDDSWIHPTRSGFGWTDLDLEVLANSELGLAKVVDGQDLTILVATDEGIYERLVPRASPLRPHVRTGLAVEQATHAAVGTWGLPDFVLPPSTERKGRGVREISDGLLVVRNLGIVMQSKARCGEPGGTEREHSWLTRQIAAAGRQIDGTVRRLRAADVEMLNGRGRTVTVEGSTTAWVGVVIIDHPDPPLTMPLDQAEGRVPAIVLLRRDWEFLFEQLRSTHAVASYLHRMGRSAAFLGGEPERYYEQARIDAETKPADLDPKVAALGPRHSAPLLPTAPAGSNDLEAFEMVRTIVEDVATTATHDEPNDSLQSVLGSLDSLPVSHRSELGRLLLDWLGEARSAAPDHVLWKSRIIFANGDEDQLQFGVCSRLDDATRAAFQGWVLLRHHERGTRMGTFADLRTVGVMLTPRNDGDLDWDTTVAAVDGDPELTSEELESYSSFWRPHPDAKR